MQKRNELRIYRKFELNAVAVGTVAICTLMRYIKITLFDNQGYKSEIFINAIVGAGLSALCQSGDKMSKGIPMLPPFFISKRKTKI